MIVTVRLLAWATLTLLSTMAILASMTTPQWLVGPPIKFIPKLARKNHSFINDNNIDDNPIRSADYYEPTLGIYNRCTRIEGFGRLHCASFIQRGYQANYTESFPVAWQATLVFFSIGLCLLVLTLVMSIVGWCARSIRRKSIFSIGGSVQALSVLFFILGLVIYPAGWGSQRVRRVCGENAEAFFLADCNLGWAFYVAIGGIALTCFSAIFSAQAEISTSTDKVQDLILEGKKVICLP